MSNKWNNTCISALMMILCGVAIGVISDHLPETSDMQKEEYIDTEGNQSLDDSEFESPHNKAGVLKSAEALESNTEINEQSDLEQRVPDVNTLNMAYCYPDDADSADPMQSYAANVLKELATFDQAQLGNINDQMDEFLSALQLSVVDGSGRQISYYSNAFEIMSLASVYSYYHDPKDYEQFLHYSKRLWEASHSYSMSLSELYYCDTCMLENDDFAQSEEVEETDAGGAEEFLTPSNATPSNATPSNATPSDAAAMECPGHIDLIVQLKILGLDGERNLFTVDPIGNQLHSDDSNWKGWNEETVLQVQELKNQDWYERYGLQTLPVQIGNALSISEIDHYMNLLPEDLSQSRKKLIRFALESVGRVPYYYGGKASRTAYEGNHFGSVVSADQKGRVLKGLDCSGWIGWVYWSVIGMEIPYATTFSLSSMGTSVERSDLKPGDILLRKGDESHAGIFLDWTDDGQIRYIHESAGTNNNVVISENGTKWSEYRRLLGD